MKYFRDMVTNKCRLENCSLTVDSVGIYLQRNVSVTNSTIPQTEQYVFQNCLPQLNRPWIPSKDKNGNDIFFWLNKKNMS